jgi:hypothetical protein
MTKYYLSFKDLDYVTRANPNGLNKNDYFASYDDIVQLKANVDAIHKLNSKRNTFYIYQKTPSSDVYTTYQIIKFSSSDESMTDKLTHIEDSHSLKHYLSLRWGPVWVQPSEQTAALYPAMKDMVGMVVRNPAQAGLHFEIDWTSSLEWEAVNGQYPEFPDKFWWDEFKILEGTYGPHYSAINPTVSKKLKFSPISIMRGHIVVIEHHKWDTWLSNNSNVGSVVLGQKKQQYSDAVIGKIIECQKYLGHVLDIDGGTVKVSFCRGEKNALITHVPKDVLVRVTGDIAQKYFATLGDINKAEVATYDGLVPIKTTRAYAGATAESPKYESAKFEKGQLVLVNSNHTKEFNGLMGIVTDINDVPHPSWQHEFVKKYTVCFDVLPNRNLMLSAHAPPIDIQKPVEFNAMPLDAYDPDLSWMPWWKVFHDNNDKKHVFVCKVGGVGKITTLINPQNRDITQGFKYKVEYQSGSARVNTTLFDRELDLDFSKEKLIAALRAAKTIRIGCEVDDRNKNESKTIVFLYLMSASGVRIEHSIMLGVLKTRRKYRRKFDECFDSGDIQSPYQVQRYLETTTKGNFFTLVSSDEFADIKLQTTETDALFNN